MSKIKDERDLLAKPGDTILETLDHMKMSQAELAERIGKTTSKVHDIITSKEPITITTAIQLEKVLGIAAQFWLNMETIYREKLMRIEQEEMLEECLDWLKAQPLRELKKCGYIKSDKIGHQMVEEVLKFYGVASPIQWENIYVDEYVSANFRRSQSQQATLAALGAWMRIGEIEMRKYELKEFDKTIFKESLIEIKKLVRRHPENFAEQLQKICFDAGVALVYTMCIPKAPVSGVARWVGGAPLIQMTDRYKSNDHFWFTFFHEAGHIIKHGKKDVFIEDLKAAIVDQKKENEANEFANEYLLSKFDINELPERITESVILDIARKNQTHPAIILGFLQKQKILPYSFGTALKLKVYLDHVIKKSGN